MKFKAITACIFTVFVGLATSCVEDDYTKQVEKWITDNDTYFDNMKDSVGYQRFDISQDKGGGFYYYKIIKQGTDGSNSPVDTDKVTVNYKGMLINGTIFDSTYKGLNPELDLAATPRTFLVYQLIPGWIFNLQQMKPGEIRTIVLPYYLGYGTYSVGSILPFSTLRFDMQLISTQ